MQDDIKEVWLYLDSHEVVCYTRDGIEVSYGDYFTVRDFVLRETDHTPTDFYFVKLREWKKLVTRQAFQHALHSSEVTAR